MQQPTFEKYAHYQAEDFLQDEYFQQWVISDDQETDEFWQAFMLRYPHQKERVAEAQKLASSIRYEPHRLSNDKQDAILERVYAASQSRENPSVFYRKKYIAVAASISLLLVAALFWLFYPTHETYVTGYQETRTVKLADGSEITLNANTSIRVAIDTDEDQARQVWLEGEAYFQVAHLDDEKTALYPALKMFVVHTDNFDIEVLGTVFNASSRDRKSQVYLEKGKVKVASEQLDQSRVLEPGDQLALSEEDKAFRLERVTKEAAPAWQENYFIFKRTPLQEVARAIENYYGLEIELTDPALSSMLFTAKIARTELNILLRAIESSFRVKTIKQGDKIIIK